MDAQKVKWNPVTVRASAVKRENNNKYKTDTTLDATTLSHKSWR